MRSTKIWVIVALLAGIGVAMMLYKHLVLEFPLAPDTKYNSWFVEARVDLYSREPWKRGDKPVVLNMQLPHPADNLVLVDENIIARRFGHAITARDAEGNREATFSKRRIDAQETIFYRAIVYELDAPSPGKAEKPPAPNSPYSKENRPQLAEGEQQAPIYLALDALIDEARERSASTKTFVREIYLLARSAQDDRVKLIRDTLDPHLTDTALAALLLEAAEVPTRIAHGIKLTQDTRRGQFIDWLEVFVKDKWQPVDPEQYSFGMQDKYIAWWYGNDRFLTLEEGRAHIESAVSVRHNTNDALTRAIWKSGQNSNVFLTFSFYNLPLESQILFKVLLMIPVGGLAIAFLRQVIGVRTFGTFMPVLIALAFRQTGPLWGVAFLCAVIGLGLAVRFYLDRLKLLLVPRLAAVVIVVVLLIAVLTVISFKLGLERGLSIGLFPIVIMTMTIERMTMVWEERGPSEAFQQGFGSIAVGILCYFVMNLQMVEHLFFVFPELLLVALAATLLIGRYSGYRLTELYRFRVLAK